jgi:hypothetical protein
MNNQTDKKQLVFVYNADSGMFNTLTDIAHKVFSPQTYECNLCAISHSYLSERSEWKAFIEDLGVQCEFLHRDEFIKKYQTREVKFPVIFTLQENDLKLSLSAKEINVCQSMEDLQQAIRTKCL